MKEETQETLATEEAADFTVIDVSGCMSSGPLH